MESVEVMEYNQTTPFYNQRKDATSASEKKPHELVEYWITAY